MADEATLELLRKAPFSFVGTVEQLGAATMSDLSIDERTAVVQVVQVLHGPQTFEHMAGQRLTVQLAPDVDPPKVRDTLAFFVEGFAFGETVAVREIGRSPLEAIESHLNLAAQQGGRGAFAPEVQQLAAERLGEHARGADAVVLGRVLKLENVLGIAMKEHDPDWWRATLQVDHVESGNVEPGEVAVLFPNSLDVRWHEVPKPKPSQEGMWILHATEGKLGEVAPFQILHAEDYQPVQQLDLIRESGSQAQ